MFSVFSDALQFMMNASPRYIPLPLSRQLMFLFHCCLLHATLSPSLNFAHVKSVEDNFGEWVKCMGVDSVCGEQEVGVVRGSGWNLWVWLVGVVVRRYIDFLIYTTYPYSSCICSFFAAAFLLLILFIKKNVFVLLPVLFCNYILCIK